MATRDLSIDCGCPPAAPGATSTAPARALALTGTCGAVVPASSLLPAPPVPVPAPAPRPAGPVGPAGIQGPVGPPGIQGPAGLTGAPGATGTIGATGLTGPTGAFGGAVTIPYLFDPVTTDSDPGAGNLRLDSGIQASSTTIRAEVIGADGQSVQSTLGTFDDSTNTVKGMIRLSKKAPNATDFLLFAVTGLVVKSGYRNITGTIVDFSSVSPFVAGDAILLHFDRAGDAGSTGTTGTAGTPGMVGAPGDAGAQGDQGDPGPPGMPGATGLQGPPGAPGDVGAQGDQGDPGPPGIPGLQGATGATGADGAAGAPGAPGPDPEPPIPGDPGPPGMPGATGLQGVPGAPGDVGAQGDQGDPGPPGVPGIQGATGATGADGTPGFAGAPGPDPEPPIPGDPGFPGPVGAPGLPGIAIVGQQGEQGDPGEMGMPGVPGIPGPSPVIQPGSFLGLQITAAGAAAAIEITGVEAGQNIRFDTWVGDTTATGNTPDYPIALGTTAVRFASPANPNLQGILGTSAGRPRFICTGNTTISLEHESASEATTLRRFKNPGSINLSLLPNETAMVIQDSDGNRQRIMGLARARSAVQANGGTITPAETLNFISGVGNTASVSATAGVVTIGFDEAPTPAYTHFEEEFVTFAAPSVPTTGSFLTTASHSWLVQATGAAGSASIPASQQNNPGIFRLTTGATSTNKAIIAHSPAVSAGVLSGNRCFYFCWIIALPSITGYGLQCGLSSDWTNTATPTDCVMFSLSPGLGVSANQRIAGAGGTSTSAIFPVAGAFLRLEGTRVGTSWNMSINGAAPFSTSITVPSALMSFGLCLTTTTAATASVDMDFASYTGSFVR